MYGQANNMPASGASQVQSHKECPPFEGEAVISYTINEIPG